MELSPSTQFTFVTTLDEAGLSFGSRPSFAYYRRDLEVLLARPSTGLIVTPNLDHLRLLNRLAALRRAYRDADVVLNDSRFLNKLSLKNRVLVMPGSELAPLMLAHARENARILVIGCDDAVRKDLPGRFQHVQFTFIEPSMGFVRKRSERRDIVRQALDLAPALTFVCTGAPQSELLAAQLKRAGLRGDILCCGSAFRFLAGSATRAPLWTRKLGAEWAFRFITEARTRKRYMADALFLARNFPMFVSLRLTGKARFSRYEIRT